MKKNSVEKSSTELFDDLQKMIEHYTMEDRITYAQVIGVLEMLKHEYMHEAKSEGDGTANKGFWNE